MVIISTGIAFSVVKGIPLTHDNPGFEALVFDEIGEITDIPEYGGSAVVINHEPIKKGITEKHKGFLNFGSTSLSLGRDKSDAGQVALKFGALGLDKNEEYSFKISFPVGGPEYFTGKIFSYTTAPGAANNIVKSTALIEINSSIVDEFTPVQPIVGQFIFREQFVIG